MIGHAFPNSVKDAPEVVRETWKTYAGRPEADRVRGMAMSLLGSGLQEVKYYEDALSVQEANLSLLRRRGSPEFTILVMQNNLAITYGRLGRREEALQMRRDVYSGRLKLTGEEHESTLTAANNYAADLIDLKRFVEARSLLRKTTPTARRVFGDSHDYTLRTRCTYARALHQDPSATLDDVREAVTTLEETAQTARRVLGGAHPTTVRNERTLRNARAALRAREALEVLQTADDLAAHFDSL